MHRSRTFFAIFALIPFLIPSVASGQETRSADVEPRLVAPPATHHSWVAPENLTPSASVLSAVSGKRASASDLRFIWPMPGEIDRDHILTGYMDHDSTSGIRDHMGNVHTYNGHKGVDLAVRNFREMDIGVPIFAAEAGVVVSTAFDNFDRNTAWDPNLSSLMNGAVIDHGDDIQTAYFHFRKNSVTVETGEEVEAGQLLGYVGSSGFSDLPHLHFEVRNFNDRYFIEPFEGSAHDGPSLWIEQPPYVGSDHLKVYDIGVATFASMGGSPNVFDWAAFLERLAEPAVFGGDEPGLVIWIQTQNQQDDPYRFEVLKPDGTAFREFETAFNQKVGYGMWYYYWPFGPDITDADYGTWTVRMLGDDGTGTLNRELYERTFDVAAETEWAPRFLPAGKSIRINGAAQRDTLRMDPFTGDVSFHVLDQPSFVSIEQDSIVVFQGESDQASRSAYFQVVATDQHARTDTMWYHVVDPSKPLDTIETSTTRIGDVAEQIHLSRNYPNPFSSSTTIEFDLPSNGHVRLQVFDVLGREVATVIDDQLSAGRHRVEWQSGDASNGLYLYRLSAGGAVETRSMMLVR